MHQRSPYTSDVEASRNVAFFAIASPSMFIVPMVPTFSVWIGFASYWGGDAGDAKCST